jgi:hypothetical protein
MSDAIVVFLIVIAAGCVGFTAGYLMERLARR